MCVCVYIYILYTIILYPQFLMVKLAAPNSSPSFIAVPLLGLFLFQAHALVHKLVLQALEHADHLKLPRRGRRGRGGLPGSSQMWTWNLAICQEYWGYHGIWQIQDIYFILFTINMQILGGSEHVDTTPNVPKNDEMMGAHEDSSVEAGYTVYSILPWGLGKVPWRLMSETTSSPQKKVILHFSSPKKTKSPVVDDFPCHVFICFPCPNPFSQVKDGDLHGIRWTPRAKPHRRIGTRRSWLQGPPRRVCHGRHGRRKRWNPGRENPPNPLRVDDILKLSHWRHPSHFSDKPIYWDDWTI